MVWLGALRLPQDRPFGTCQVRILIREALLYAAVSAFSLGVDIATLFILVQYFLSPYLLASTVSYSAGLCVGYVLCITAVFKNRRLKRQPLEFAGFAVVGVIGLVINAAVMSFAVGYMGIHYLSAKFSASFVTFTWNFCARRRLLFVLPNATA